MSMTPEEARNQAIGAANKAIECELKGIGIKKGAPCRFVSSRELSTGLEITFEWEGIDGTVERGYTVIPKDLPLDIEVRVIGNESHLIFLYKNNVEYDAGKLPDSVIRQYEHKQNELSNVWFITHGLNKKNPSILCFDEKNNEIYGEVEFYSINMVIIKFCVPVKGIAIVQ